MNTTIRFVSAIAILNVLAACGGSVSVEEHLTRANQFIAESKYRSAIIELKNVLQEDKQSAEARWLLGRTYLESGDVRSAEKELQHALRLKWPEEDVIPALAKSMLTQGKYDEVSKLNATDLTAHGCITGQCSNSGNTGRCRGSQRCAGHLARNRSGKCCSLAAKG
jgi:Tfp pilus assembly protein PilF